eukprot:NODE_80_length_22829_cov_0.188121.p16 type:complete len:108 gc:universal NODE_80_length_22829_cov_0.188121:3189-3512(+)
MKFNMKVHTRSIKSYAEGIKKYLARIAVDILCKHTNMHLSHRLIPVMPGWFYRRRIHMITSSTAFYFNKLIKFKHFTFAAVVPFRTFVKYCYPFMELTVFRIPVIFI